MSVIDGDASEILFCRRTDAFWLVERGNGVRSQCAGERRSEDCNDREKEGGSKQAEPAAQPSLPGWSEQPACSHGWPASQPASQLIIIIYSGVTYAWACRGSPLHFPSYLPISTGRYE